MTTVVGSFLYNVEILHEQTPDVMSVLTPGALEFIVRLQRQFNHTRKNLLDRRRQVQAQFDAGVLPDFLSDTIHIRQADWTIAPPPADLRDRRVEITGPVDRKMIINALNSGAKVFMADFEDSTAPTWNNLIQGQINLCDAVRGTISYSTPTKEYRLNETVAALVVRPRGWHMVEKHLHVDGEPMSASLFDFGLYFYHNAKALMARGSGPYFYLPKMESHLEARLWNDVFIAAQRELGISQGTIKATVLIETLPAAFEMDEILYELREHITGLNCGRWDYIFSFIKKFRMRPEYVLPDRGTVTMLSHFLRSYSLLLIQTCHRRGAYAMGGMAAQIPIKDDEAANRVALAKVTADKQREAVDGHDGTWVAHPGLVPVAMTIFNEVMPGANQLHVKRTDVTITAQDLVAVPMGCITEAGMRQNINVGIRYLECWLRGNGCVPIYNLMEDAATAEISRTQLWQWVRHPRGLLTDGRRVTFQLIQKVIDEELEGIRNTIAPIAYRQSRFDEAAELFESLIAADELPEFLTTPAYDMID